METEGEVRREARARGGGLAVLVIIVSWLGLMVWLAKAGADSFKNSLGDVTRY